MNPPPAGPKDRDSMLDLPLRPGDRQSELPFGPDRLRGEEPSRPRVASPPRAPRPRRRRPPVSGKRRIAIGVAVVALLVLAYLLFWPKPPEPAFSADPFVFERVRVGESGDVQTLTVSNIGERPLPIQMLGIVGDNAEEVRLEEDGCGQQTLAPLATCAVLLRFAPGAMGPRRAVLELHGEMPDSPARLTLAGEGTAPVLGVTPGSGGFGAVDVGQSSPPLDLAVGNEGTAPLQVRRVALAGIAERDFRLTRNDCSKQTLAPGERCALRVIFVPRAAGSRQAELVLDTDALPPQPRVELSGEGIWTGAAFAVEPDAVDFARQLVGAEAVSRAIRITNRQGTTLSGLRVGLAAGSDGFTVAGQSCRGARLEPGESCQITVAFAPREEGERAGLLEITQPDVGTLGIELRGSGVAPRWQLDTGSLGFAEVRVGQTSAAQRLVLRNDGSAAAEVRRLALGGADPGGFSVGEDGCTGRSVAPGERCALELRFAPSREGQHVAQVDVEVTAGKRPAPVALTGLAVAPRLSLDREMVSFDRVHRTTTRQVELTLANRGTAALSLGPLVIADDPQGSYRVAGGSCTGRSVLSAGDACSLVIAFAPAVEGRTTARLEIGHDGISGPRELPLSGIGLPPPIPKLILEQASVDFGPQPLDVRSSIQTVSLAAGGTGLLELREFTLEGPHAGDFRIVPATCHAGPSLQPGTACAIGLRFTPTAAGVRSAVLVVWHNAGGGRDSVQLRGEGIGGAPQ